jgi:TIGR01777 family protein
MTDAAPGRVVIAGGTGYLGQLLAARPSACRYEVVVLSRHSGRAAAPRVRRVAWDGRTLNASWPKLVNGAVAVVNLAGRPVDSRHTPATRDEILRSRLESTAVLGQACAEAPMPPRAWVQASGAGYYGDPPEVVCDESSPPGMGFLADVAQRWEHEFDRACPAGVRGVVLRFGMVLGAHGGPLLKLARFARLGLGGTVGRGTQGMSWIHEADALRILEWSITCPEAKGAYVTCAPDPVTNRAFMRELRRSVGAPMGLPAPAWLVRLVAPAVLGLDAGLALDGRRCVPTRLLNEGFTFEFADLHGALADLFSPQSTAQHATG